MILQIILTYLPILWNLLIIIIKKMDIYRGVFMYLMYLDESGSTGLDLENNNQPIFVLAGIIVNDKNWHKVNDIFEREKIKIYPDFKDLEIHTNELFNSNRKSAFYHNFWKDNLEILEKLVDIIITLDIELFCTVINKKNYKKKYGNNIIVDPYLFSFAALYEKFNDFLVRNNQYGIIFCDELKNIEKSLEILYPKLNTENKNIIEKTFYLDSKKNNFIQIADICSFYINKFHCLSRNLINMNPYKKQHCLQVYEKISTILGSTGAPIKYDDYSDYFA